MIDKLQIFILKYELVDSHIIWVWVFFTMLACCIAIFFLHKNDDNDSVRSAVFFHYSVIQNVAFLVTTVTNSLYK